MGNIQISVLIGPSEKIFGNCCPPKIAQNRSDKLSKNHPQISTKKVCNQRPKSDIHIHSREMFGRKSTSTHFQCKNIFERGQTFFYLVFISKNLQI